MLVWVEFAQQIQRIELLLEHIGATREGSNVRMLLKNMVGPCGLEPQTSTVSTTYKAVGDCQVLDNTQKSDTSRVAVRVDDRPPRTQNYCAFSEISRSFISEQREGMALAFDRVYAGEGF
jgi:hypothetical protein